MLQYYFHVITRTPPPPPNFVFNGRYIYLFTSILQVRLNENIYLLTQTTQEKEKQKDN